MHGPFWEQIECDVVQREANFERLSPGSNWILLLTANPTSTDSTHFFFLCSSLIFTKISLALVASRYRFKYKQIMNFHVKKKHTKDSLFNLNNKVFTLTSQFCIRYQTLNISLNVINYNYKVKL